MIGVLPVPCYLSRTRQARSYHINLLQFLSDICYTNLHNCSLQKMANIIVKSDEKEVVSALCSLVEGKARAALSENPSSTFNLGLSGGSLAKFLCAGLPKIDTDWTRWRLFFCDERLVPDDDPDSTWGVYRSGLLELTPLTAEQFLTVDTSLSPAEAAADYQSKLIEVAGAQPKLDLLLLGAGPDGHTCSLFPNHPLLAEPAPPEGRIVADITDSPKPPSERVTLTLPVQFVIQPLILKLCFKGG